MNLPGWLYPLRNIRTPWKTQDLEDAGTDGHSLPVANPSGDSAEVPKKGWFLLDTFWPPQGIAELDTGVPEAEWEAGRQAACSGWYRQNSSVLSSCPICVLAESRLAVDEAEIAGWICKPISWS